MHVTTFIADTDGLREFLEAARNLRTFEFVQPVTREKDGRVIAVVFYSKDLDGISDELEMDQVAACLSGILAEDVEIVSAWESHSDRERDRVWKVPGRTVSRVARLAP